MGGIGGTRPRAKQDKLTVGQAMAELKKAGDTTIAGGAKITLVAVHTTQDGRTYGDYKVERWEPEA
jgi:hypothetical protein